MARKLKTKDVELAIRHVERAVEVVDYRLGDAPQVARLLDAVLLKLDNLSLRLRAADKKPSKG